MAIGSVVGGRVADRVRSPLRLYGLLELVLVVVVLADAGHVPAAPRGLPRRSTPRSRTTPERARARAVRAGARSRSRPATVLMGATLPTLTRVPHAARRRTSPPRSAGCTRRTRSGRSSGRSSPGFVLIELLGPDRDARRRRGVLGDRRARRARSSTAGDVDRAAIDGRPRSRPPRPIPARRGARPTRRRGSARSAARLALAVAFVSGLTSLGYQVLWTRLLAVGDRQLDLRLHDDPGDVPHRDRDRRGRCSRSGPRVRDRRRRARGRPGRRRGPRALGGLVLVIASRAVHARPQTRARPARAIAAARSLLVVLPTTIVMGLTLPGLVGARWPTTPADVASSTGLLLAANTLGAIVGDVRDPVRRDPARRLADGGRAARRSSTPASASPWSRGARMRRRRPGASAASAASPVVAAIAVGAVGRARSSTRRAPASRRGRHGLREPRRTRSPSVQAGRDRSHSSSG